MSPDQTSRTTQPPFGLLREILQSILEEDLTQVLNLISGQSITLLNGYSCHIRLYDEKTGCLVLAGGQGPYLAIAESRRPLDSHHLSAKVFATQKTIVLDSLQALPEFIKLQQETKQTEAARRFFKHAKSQIIMPIVCKGKCIGITSIYSSVEGFFDTEKVRIFEDINRITALAIEHHRLKKIQQEDTEERKRRIQLTHELSAHFRSQIHLPELLVTVVQKTWERIGAEAVNLFILNPKDNQLHKEATYSDGGILDFAETIPPGEGLTGRTFSNDKAFSLLNDAGAIQQTTIPSYYKQYLRLPSQSFRQYLGVPLINEAGNAFGVFEVINKKNRSYSLDHPQLDREGFSSDDVELLQLIANIISIVIIDLRKNSNLQLLSRISEKIASSFNRKQILETVVHSIIELDYDGALLAFFHNNRIEAVESGGLSMDPAELSGLAIDLADCLACLQPSGQINMGQPLFRTCIDLSDPCCTMPFAALLAQKGYQSLICFPLMLEGAIIGTLQVLMKNRYDFSAAEIDLLQAFANQTAVAIQTCQLFEEKNRTIATLEQLQSIGKAVSGFTNLNQILDTILNEITKQPFGFSYGTITLKLGDRIKTVAGSKNVSEEWIRLSDYPLDSEDIQADIIRKGKPEILKAWDPRFNKEIFEKFGHDRLIRAFVPIKFRLEILGTLEVGDLLQHRPSISRQELAVLEAFMDYAGIAIKNAGLFKAQAQRTQSMVNVEEAIKEIIESNNLPDILQSTVNHAVQLAGADAGYIALCSKTDTLLKPAVQTPSSLSAPTIDYSVSRDITARVVQTKQVQMYQAPAPGRDQAAGTSHSAMAVPLTYEGEVIGVLNVHANRANAFSHDALTLINILAGQASLVIQKQRYFDSLESLSSQFDYLKDLDLLYEEIIDKTNATMDTRYSILWKLRDDGALVPVAGAGAFRQADCVIREIPPGSDPLQRAVAGADLQSFEDIQKEEAFVNQKVVRKLNLHSMLAIPIFVQNKEIDVLLLNTYGNRPLHFSRIEIRLYQILAIKANAAISLALKASEQARVLDMLTNHARLIGTGQIAMGFAHDSRNSLHTINALLSTLIDTIPAPTRQRPEIEDVIHTLTAETEQLGTYFGRLTNYARLVDSIFETNDLHEIIQFVGKIFSPKMSKKKINIDMTDIEDGLEIECDRYQIEQVFMNLINNSIYAIDEARTQRLKIHGQITIRARRIAERAEIYFTDDGIGIVQSNIPQIFEPFFSTKGKKGTGFGLTICRLVVEKNHKGVISVKSDFGSGATFYISLPLKAEKN